LDKIVCVLCCGRVPGTEVIRGGVGTSKGKCYSKAPEQFTQGRKDVQKVPVAHGLQVAHENV